MDDLARAIAIGSGATIGLHRFSLTQLAARLAAPVLAAEGLAPATPLASEAVAARATFEAQREGALSYFQPVASTPGFPRALARTLQELRLADVASDRLATLPLGGRDLAALLERFDQQFAAASATDRARLFDAAIRALDDAEAGRAAPLLLLDVPLESHVEAAFVRALIAAHHATRTVVRTCSSPSRSATSTSLDRFESMGLVPEVLEQKGRRRSRRAAALSVRHVPTA